MFLIFSPFSGETGCVKRRTKDSRNILRVPVQKYHVLQQASVRSTPNVTVLVPVRSTFTTLEHKEDNRKVKVWYKFIITLQSFLYRRRSHPSHFLSWLYGTWYCARSTIRGTPKQSSGIQSLYTLQSFLYRMFTRPRYFTSTRGACKGNVEAL